MKKLVIFFAFISLMAGNARAQTTLADLLQGIRDRSVAIDYVRFTDSLLRRFLDDEQENLAVEGRAIKKELIIEMNDTMWAYVLPSDFYIPFAATMNSDPTQSDGAENRPYSLTYVPYEKYGMVTSYDAGRPEQYSYWGDSLFFNKISTTGNDSVFLKYIARPTDLDLDTAQMDLPEEYKTLLIDRVVIRCFDRLINQPPSRENIEKELTRREINVLGRPIDDQTMGKNPNK